MGTDSSSFRLSYVYINTIIFIGIGQALLAFIALLALIAFVALLALIALIALLALIAFVALKKEREGFKARKGRIDR